LINDPAVYESINDILIGTPAYRRCAGGLTGRIRHEKRVETGAARAARHAAAAGRRTPRACRSVERHDETSTSLPPQAGKAEGW
jgi:hypothetical protein